MSYLYKTLTVDPGLNTGVAYWDGGRQPEWIKVERTTTSDLDELADKFDLIFIRNEILKVTIENVSLWAGSLKSLTAVKSGALFTLARLIGRYEQVCANYDVATDLVDPRKWKGQLTNEALRGWIRDKIDLDIENEHVLCAVGIGLFKMGVI